MDKKSIFSKNISHLRSQKKMTQEELANIISVSRPAYANYESSEREPSLEILRRISNYFGVTIDILVSVDLKNIPLDNLMKLDNNRILLPITVSRDGKEKIEIVNDKASAGYMAGYGDPDYIASLQKMSIPFLNVGNYRAFPIKGDSMLPVKDGSFIIGKFIENITDIRDGKTYIVVTQNDGLVYKRLYKRGDEVELVSDNPTYDPYRIHVSEIMELWEFGMMMNRDDSISEPNEDVGVMTMLKSIKKDIKELKN